MSCRCMNHSEKGSGEHNMHDHGNMGSKSDDSIMTAMGILNIRYAKGEISMEEYKSMKNEITSGQ